MQVVPIIFIYFTFVRCLFEFTVIITALATPSETFSIFVYFINLVNLSFGQCWAQFHYQINGLICLKSFNGAYIWIQLNIMKRG